VAGAQELERYAEQRIPSFQTRKENVMSNRPKEGTSGTSDQWPRWEGPPENKPRGYLPAKDDPDKNRDAAGESLKDPEKSDLSDAVTTKKNA
jgi:hypothetical protein